MVGEKASIEWWDEHPNQIIFSQQGKPVQILDRGQGYLFRDEEMVDGDRMGAGHAEGLFEAWANIYRRFALAMDRVNKGVKASKVMDSLWFPSIRDGAEGVRFVEKCVSSADQGSVWVNYAEN